MVWVGLLVGALYHTSSINGFRYSLGWVGLCYAPCGRDSGWGSSPFWSYSPVSSLIAIRQMKKNEPIIEQTITAASCPELKWFITFFICMFRNSVFQKIHSQCR